MRFLRTFIRQRRRLAIVLLALTLCMKALMPTGFMIGVGGKSLSITICDGHGPELIKQISLPQAGPSHERASEQGKAPDACPYSALTMTAVSGAEASLLMAALAYILIMGAWPPARNRLARRSFLRPPLRAPPLWG